jgi:hypothetical protein
MKKNKIIDLCYSFRVLLTILSENSYIRRRAEEEEQIYKRIHRVDKTAMQISMIIPHM